MNKKGAIKYLGIGLIVEDLTEEKDLVKINPIEIIGEQYGNLNNTTFVEDYSTVDIDGNPIVGNVSIGQSVLALWYGKDSILSKPPRITRGERVELYVNYDTQQYLWNTINLDKGLRRLDEIDVMLPGFTDTTENLGRANIELTPDNSYNLNASTVNKNISITTTKLNEELAEYKININTGTGIISIEDDIGNIITLNSTEKVINLTNGDGSIIDINKKNINVTVPDTLTVEATNQVSVKSKEINMLANSIKLDGIVTSGPLSISLPGAGVSSVSTDNEVGILSSVVCDIKGSCNISGDLNIEGKLGTSGDATIGGKLTANKVISTTNIDAPNV